MTLRPSLCVQAQVTLPQPPGRKPDRALEAAPACLPGHLGGWPELHPTGERIPSHPREDTVTWPCLASGAGLREGRAGGGSGRRRTLGQWTSLRRQGLWGTRAALSGRSPPAPPGTQQVLHSGTNGQVLQGSVGRDEDTAGQVPPDPRALELSPSPLRPHSLPQPACPLPQVAASPAFEAKVGSPAGLAGAAASKGLARWDFPGV